MPAAVDAGDAETAAARRILRPPAKRSHGSPHCQRPPTLRRQRRCRRAQETPRQKDYVSSSRLRLLLVRHFLCDVPVFSLPVSVPFCRYLIRTAEVSGKGGDSSKLFANSAPFPAASDAVRCDRRITVVILTTIEFCTARVDERPSAFRSTGQAGSPRARPLSAGAARPFEE